MAFGRSSWRYWRIREVFAGYRGISGYNQHAPCQFVAGTSQWSDSSAVAAGSLTGCQTDEGHQPPWVIESLKIAEFGHATGGHQQLDIPKRLNDLDQ